MKKPKRSSPKRIVDERDPVWSSLHNLTAGLNPEERFNKLNDLVKNVMDKKNSLPQHNDLQNLPFDPAQDAGKHSAEVEQKRLSEDNYDPIEEAMKRFPNLTREEALKMAQAFGF